MEPTISRFLLFLGSEFVFIFAAFLLMFLVGILIAKERKLKNGFATLSGIMATLVTVGFMYLSLRILTGQDYFWTFSILAAAVILLSLLVELIWLILGDHNVPWFGRVIWAEYEFEHRSPRINKLLKGGSSLILVIYAVYIGYGYFGDAFAGADWAAYVLRATLVVLVGFSWVTQLPAQLCLMTSRNLKEGTRSRLFINQLGQSISVLLLISLFIGTMRGAEATVPFLGPHFVFSPTVGVATLIYLLALVILPYLIGHFRARHWIEDLAEIRSEIITTLSNSLDSPNLTTVNQAFEVADNRVETLLRQWQASRFISLAEEVRNSNELKNFVYQLALDDSLKRDPRFIHINRLGEIQHRLHEYREALATKQTDEEKHHVLKAYSEVLGKEKEAQKDTDRGTRPWVMVGIASVFGSLLNPIVSSLAKLVAVKLGIPQ